MAPRPWWASISRHMSQPSTAGPSIKMIRRTSGSSDASRKACRACRRRSNQVVAGDRHAGLRPEVGLDLFEHRAEQRFLVGEMVVQRASGADAGCLDDLVGSGREVPLLAEQPAGGREDAPACHLGLLLANTDHERTVPGALRAELQVLAFGCQLAHERHLTVTCQSLYRPGIGPAKPSAGDGGVTQRGDKVADSRRLTAFAKRERKGSQKRQIGIKNIQRMLPGAAHGMHGGNIPPGTFSGRHVADGDGGLLLRHVGPRRTSSTTARAACSTWR